MCPPAEVSLCSRFHTVSECLYTAIALTSACMSCVPVNTAIFTRKATDMRFLLLEIATVVLLNFISSTMSMFLILFYPNLYSIAYLLVFDGGRKQNASFIHLLSRLSQAGGLSSHTDLHYTS